MDSIEFIIYTLLTLLIAFIGYIIYDNYTYKNIKDKGLNNFDIVYYINLEHRKDRYIHINNELSKTNIDPNKINRIDAIYDINKGYVGCSKSHILALEAFINTPDEIQNCIILEDDFIFTEEQDDINNLINLFFENVETYDVLMLSSNTLNETKTIFPFITKINDAQTLSGYCVSKKFAPILLDNYRSGVEKLESIGTCDLYCVDMYMKILQPKSLWFCLNPKIGKQKISYSDIQKTVVSYNC
jgi:GR25 family glycosyltransferase involved in LPS biosynthesis